MGLLAMEAVPNHTSGILQAKLLGRVFATVPGHEPRIAWSGDSKFVSWHGRQNVSPQQFGLKDVWLGTEAVCITSWYQNSMEAILACHPALSTKRLDWLVRWGDWWRMHMAPLHIVLYTNLFLAGSLRTAKTCFTLCSRGFCQFSKYFLQQNRNSISAPYKCCTL